MACAAALTDAVTAYAPDTCTRYLNTPAERMLPHANAAGGGSMHTQHKQAMAVTSYAPDTSTHLPACTEIGLSQSLEHECLRV